MNELKNIEFCPICSSAKNCVRINCIDHTVSRETFQITECSECGFLFTNPRPTDDLLASYYKSEEYISHTNSKRGFFNKLYQAVRRRTMKQKIKLIGKKRGKLLELGSGTGDLLALCKKHGWDCTGIEPDPNARKEAKKNHELDLAPLLEEKNIKKSGFDVIMMWHVLEHIPNLNETLKIIKKGLSENGLCYIAVPNHKSLDSKIYKSAWAAYDVPRHLYHFDKSSISKIMEKHGFIITKTVPMWFDSFYVSILSEEIKTDKKNFFKGLIIGALSNLKAMILTGEFSSHIYVFKHE